MSDYEVVETVYGSSHKYEILRRAKTFGGYEFYVHKDGKPFKGSYSTLASAVAAAENEG